VAEAEEKSKYDIVLESAGEKKIQVIKAVREINQAYGLAEAKAVVDEAPKTIAEGVKKDEAEAAKAKLEEAGATVTLK
jgi:large subunit ribosomal protein L7/L12